MSRRALRRCAFTLVELLGAAIIIGIVCSGALATWNLSARAPVNQRVTDMGSIVALRELERLKAVGYTSLTDTGNSYTTTYYDKDGVKVDAGIAKGYYARSYVRVAIDRDATTNAEDLREIYVEVYTFSNDTKVGTERTLITFGGI